MVKRLFLYFFPNQLYMSYGFWKFYLIALYYLFNKGGWCKNRDKRLCYILNYARCHSRYYKLLLGEKVITEENCHSVLKSLPQLSKDIIKEKNWDIYSDEVNKEWTNWRNTGGSTGEPLKFPALATPYYSEDICQMMLYIHMGFRPGDTLASIDGSRVGDAERAKNIYWVEKRNFPYGKHAYSTLYLNEHTFPYYLDSLNKLSPKFMRGYPSGFLTLCHFIESMHSKVTFRLKGVYLTSENYTKEDSDYISSILQCPVYGQYGHTECSVFAVKRPYERKYLCSPLYGLTEVLDEHGNLVKEGESGEVVVTGFSIAGLPFIRYKTGDLAVYGGETKYGETILSELLGRTGDFVYDLDGKKIYTVGFIFGGHLKIFNYLKQWQIEQNVVGELLIRIVKGIEYNESVENDIIEFFENNRFIVKIQYVEDIPQTIRGKKKFLIQNLK